MSTNNTLYRFFDNVDRLLYVGISGNPGRRFNEHGKEKGWSQEVVRSTMQHFSTREEAAAAEVAAILTERPLHNVTHNQGKPLATPRTPRVRFVCDICQTPIVGASGYVQVDIRTAGRYEDDDNDFDIVKWQTLHRACDPNVSSSHYWWATDRLTTTDDLIRFEDHMVEKSWVEWTDLDEFVEGLMHRAER